jgi:hypothetical protein
MKWLAVIPAAVVSDRKLSSSAKVVYAAIASYTANGTKECFPSHAAIAERAGMGMRSISRPIHELARAGYIEVTRRGKRQSNLYEVTTLKSDITEKCNHIPAGGDNAEMRTPLIRIPNKNILPPDAAKEIVPPKPPSPVNDFKKTFAEMHEHRTGQKYIWSHAKDGALIKSMLEAVEIGVLQCKAAAFFQSKDKFIQDAGYTLGVFKSQLNKLTIPKQSTRREQPAISPEKREQMEQDGLI